MNEHNTADIIAVRGSHFENRKWHKKIFGFWILTIMQAKLFQNLFQCRQGLYWNQMIADALLIRRRHPGMKENPMSIK